MARRSACGRTRGSFARNVDDRHPPARRVRRRRATVPRSCRLHRGAGTRRGRVFGEIRGGGARPRPDRGVDGVRAPPSHSGHGHPPRRRRCSSTDRAIPTRSERCTTPSLSYSISVLTCAAFPSFVAIWTPRLRSSRKPSARDGSASALPSRFEHEHGGRHRDVERLAAPDVRDRDPASDRARQCRSTRRAGRRPRCPSPVPRRPVRSDVGVRLDRAARSVVAGGADRGETRRRRRRRASLRPRARGRARPQTLEPPSGCTGRRCPGVRTTRSAPDASAERRIVPRLPGSAIASSTTTNDARCQQIFHPAVIAHPHDRDRVLRGLGRCDSIEDTVGQLEHAPGPLDARLDHAVGLGGDELRLALPTGRNRLGDEDRPFDDEATFVVTRTAAPDQAPQLLYSWIVERQRTHRAPVWPLGPRNRFRRARPWRSRRACRTRRRR